MFLLLIALAMWVIASAFSAVVVLYFTAKSIIRAAEKREAQYKIQGGMEPQIDGHDFCD